MNGLWRIDKRKKKKKRNRTTRPRVLFNLVHKKTIPMFYT